MNAPSEKDIREALGDLTLQNGLRRHLNNNNSGITTEDRKRSIGSTKNHFLKPSLVFNAQFDKENSQAAMDLSVQQIDFGDDTVLHNKDTHDTTMPEWLKVKLEVEEKKRKSEMASKSTLPIPHLVTCQMSETTDKGSTDGGYEGDTAGDHIHLAADTTWEEMKRNYNIERDDLYGDVTSVSQLTKDDDDDNKVSSNSDDNQYLMKPFDERAMNSTAYSFTDSNCFNVNSETIPSIGTAKVTSYRTEYLDSPMPRPKLIKTFDDPIPQIKRPQLKTAEFHEIHLITPTDEGMIYDSKQKMWVYPNPATQGGYGYELVFDDETCESGSQTNMNTTIAVDPRHVTNVSGLDLSFSESRRALVSALQDVLRTRENWDKVSKVDISGRGLLTVKSLEEFLPNIREVNLNDNALTSLEGLTGHLQTALLANNCITDQFLNFGKFTDMQKLDLSYNGVTKLSLFSSLSNLRYLYLSNCEINELVSMPSLLKLNLSNNKIEGVVDFAHLDFMNLQELDLSGNKITGVQNLNCPELRQLNLENNNITTVSIPKSLPKMKKLLFAGNENLDVLSVGTKLKQLKFLSVSGSTQVKGKFPELLTFCLFEGDKLSTLQSSDLIISPYLQEIVLRSCQLGFEDLDKLWNMFPHLRSFDLRNNEFDCRFAELVKFFMQFGKVTSVRMEDNPVTDRLKDRKLLKVYELMIYKLTHQL